MIHDTYAICRKPLALTFRHFNSLVDLPRPGAVAQLDKRKPILTVLQLTGSVLSKTGRDVWMKWDRHERA